MSVPSDRPDAHRPDDGDRPVVAAPGLGRPDVDRRREVADAARRAFSLLPARADEVSPFDGSRGRGGAARRLRTDPETVERDLLKLVLTIVELLRQLMERQALHRVDQGDLTEEQEERLGLTLMVLHDRMAELCERYDLTLEDLNLDLGPLGTLLPP